MNKILCYILLIAAAIMPVHSQIRVDNTTFTADQLVRDVLINSTCATVSNITSSTGSGVNQNGIAFFEENGSGFPITNGVILSSGHAPNAVGPNWTSAGERPTLSDNLGTPGDSDLTTALSGSTPAVNPRDSSSITFDFIPQAEFISFDFLFASEEYNGSFECEFSDAFAFLLTDSVTGTTTNLAVLPGTTEPIRVTNIHPEVPNECAAINEQYFDRYNNSPQGLTSPTQFNGRTVLLTAQSNVVVNRSYTIKLVVADSADSDFDSAVFIAGGSFNIGPDLGSDRTIADNNPLCQGDSFTLDASVAGAAQSYQWNLNNTPISGATNATFDATQSGQYTVDIQYSPTCTATASINLEFLDIDIVSPTDLQICAFENAEVIDLTSKNPEILGNLDPSNHQVTFYESLADANAGTNAIPNPESYVNTLNLSSVFVVVDNLTFSCSSMTTLTFDIIDLPNVVIAPDLELCDANNTNDLIEEFDLTTNQDIILDGQTDITVTYHLTQSDADDNINAITNPSSIENTTTPQTIYVRLENTSGCFNTTNFDLVVNESPASALLDQYYICTDRNGNLINSDNSPPRLDTGLTAAGLEFVWERNNILLPSQIQPSIIADLQGSYTVTITDTTTGCATSHTTQVDPLGPPDDYGASVTTRYFNQVHIIEAFAQGPATQYIFRLDDGPWQYNGTFNDVSPGPHTVTIQDVDACASVSVPLDVIGYPRYFTPNNDGYHDYWNIIGINNEPSTKIYIFDQYGKLLKQINPDGLGWDGNYNNQPLPSTDYWFKIEYIENDQAKTFTGHFTLKR